MTLRGAGDLIAVGLEAVGITKQRADRFAKAIGFSGCGCDSRQRWFNELIPFAAPTLPQIVTVADTADCEAPPDGFTAVVFARKCRPCVARECLQVEADSEQELWMHASCSVWVAQRFLAGPGEAIDTAETLQTLRRSGYSADAVDVTAPLQVDRDRLRYLFGLFEFPNPALCWRTLYRNVYRD